MRAEGFTRWDAFLQLNFHPRKQVNPLMTQEQEQQLSQTMLAMMQSGGDAPKSTVEVPVYAWRLIRWEADVPLTEEQRQEALAIVPEAMALCGVSAACFAADGDVMTVLLALTRFPARAHRDPVLWLCAHALMEQASVALEQDGTMFIGEEFDLAATWAEHLKPMREISDWWTRVSPLDGAAARTCRGICRQENLDLGLGKDDRSDVPSFGDNVCVLGRGALKLNHGSPHLGDCGDGGDVLVDLGRPDGLRSIGSVDDDDGTLGAVLERDLDAVGEICDCGGIGHVDAAGEGGVGNGAVHGTGVEIRKAFARGHGPRNRGLAGPGRPVNGNDHVFLLLRAFSPC